MSDRKIELLNQDETLTVTTKSGFTIRLEVSSYGDGIHVDTDKIIHLLFRNRKTKVIHAKGGLSIFPCMRLEKK